MATPTHSKRPRDSLSTAEATFVAEERNPPIATAALIDLIQEAKQLEIDVSTFCQPSRKLIGEGPGKFLKETTASFMDIINKFALECVELERKNAVLATMGGPRMGRVMDVLEALDIDRKLDDLKQNQENLAASLTQVKKQVVSGAPTTQGEHVSKPSFAALAARQAQVAPPKEKLVITVRDGQEAKTADELKTIIKTAVKPVDDGFQVVALRRRGPNALLIETSTQAQAESIIKHKALADSNLVAKPLGKLRPRLIIYDAPRDMPDTEVLRAIKRQNFPNANDEQFSDSIKLNHKTGPRDRDTVNWVVEVRPDFRNVLKAQERIFIGWRACRVDDFLAVSRCFKCQGLGHISKYCRSSRPVCAHCSETGHEKGDCPHKEAPPTCGSCKSLNRSFDHVANGNKCPNFLRALDMKAGSIDYGD